MDESFDFSLPELAREIFGLELPCTRAVLKSKYRKLIWKLHPDHGGAEEEFVAVQRAYELLLADEHTFSDSPRRARGRCGICGGSGWARLYDDKWTPFRPCFTCFTCRSTLGCRRCMPRGFHVQKSNVRKFMACRSCHGSGETMILPPTKRELPVVSAPELSETFGGRLL